MGVLTLLVVFFVVIFGTLAAFAMRYKRCPSDKILVIYGKTAGGLSYRCLHGGAAFIWPLIQAYQFLDLTPIPIDIKLEGALSRENIRINTPATFTVGISTEPGIMENAAERLLGLSLNDIQQLSQDIIFGQMRAVMASMPAQEIRSDRSKLLDSISSAAEAKLREVGLHLIDIDIQDVTTGRAEDAEKAPPPESLPLAASPPPPGSGSDESGDQEDIHQAGSQGPGEREDQS